MPRSRSGMSGCSCGEPLDVRLVDHGAVVGDARRDIPGPVEALVDDDAEHHARGGVVVVANLGIVEVVAEQRLVPLEVTAGRLGVRVEQQLVPVGSLAGGRVIRPGDPVPVPLTWTHPRQVGVPDERVDLLQHDPGLDALGVEQAQLDALGDLAEEREVRTVAVPGGSEWVCRARPVLDHCVVSITQSTVGGRGTSCGGLTGSSSPCRRAGVRLESNRRRSPIDHTAAHSARDQSDSHRGHARPGQPPHRPLHLADGAPTTPPGPRDRRAAVAPAAPRRVHAHGMIRIPRPGGIPGAWTGRNP